MWISQQAFDRMQTDRAAAEAKATVLAEQNKALLVTQDWFRVRLTQLEHERAQLIWNYIGIKTTPPVFEATTKNDPPAEGHPLTSVPSFHDMGDTEAAKLGISWNPDGTVNYGKATA